MDEDTVCGTLMGVLERGPECEVHPKLRRSVGGMVVGWDCASAPKLICVADPRVPHSLEDARAQACAGLSSRPPSRRARTWIFGKRGLGRRFTRRNAAPAAPAESPCTYSVPCILVLMLAGIG